MKISIIIKSSNIEKYLKECIDSILNQKYNNFELILINDGSTDNCEKICKRYSKDKRVKYYYKKNGGLSDARNYGIKKATGDYIMFVDGDDFLKNELCLDKIVKKLLKENCDILQYKMAYFYTNKNKIQEFDNFYYNFSSDNLYSKLNELNKHGKMSISACDKIVKTSIIEKNKIYFENGLYSEDIDWSLHLYLYANSIEILDETVYIYRQQRVGSITTTKSKKRCQDLWYIIKKWYNYNYPNYNLKDLYYNYLAYQILILITITSKNTFNNNEIFLIKQTCLKLIQYDKNYKVKMFKKIYNLFGFKISTNLMKVYLSLKNKGVIKI